MAALKVNKNTVKELVLIDGTRKWYLNDLLHREDGPAVEWADGDREWWLNGQLHREDGPAVEYTNDTEWWLNGRLVKMSDVLDLSTPNGVLKALEYL